MLSGLQHFFPEDSERGPKGTILLIHGMAEHCQRYRPIAEMMAKGGYAVFTYDQRGHGTAIEKGVQGHFADRGGWQLLLSDVEAARQAIVAQYPQLPFGLVGHSMGSFIAQSYAIEYGSKLSGLALSASSYMNPMFMQVSRLIPFLESLRQGGRGKSKLVQALSFGSFNKPFKPNRTHFDWLSRDPNEVDKYCHDPLCGFLCSNQTWLDFLGALATIFTASEQAKLPKTLPIYIFGGSLDPVSKGGGLRKLEASFKRAGVKDVRCRIYEEARHEVFNETNRAEVVSELLAWLDGHLVGARSVG